MKKLTKKIQVSVTSEEVCEINWAILINALQMNKKPQSLSAFVRKVLKNELKNRLTKIKNYD